LTRLRSHTGFFPGWLSVNSGRGQARWALAKLNFSPAMVTPEGRQAAHEAEVKRLILPEIEASRLPIVSRWSIYQAQTA
jgi:hypothetical protein